MYTIDNYGPQVSCDGSTVVWRGADEFYFGIFKNGVALPSTANYNFSPQVSCDGSTVVWYGEVGRLGDIPGVWTIFKNGVSLSSPPLTTDISNPQVSCDGSTVVWGGFVAGVQTIIKNGVALATPLSTNNNSPQVSCDGSIVVWEGTVNGVRTIIKNGVPLPAPLSTSNFNAQLIGDGSTVAWIGTINGVRTIFKNTDCVTTCYTDLTHSSTSDLPPIESGEMLYESSTWIVTGESTVMQTGADIEYSATNYIELNGTKDHEFEVELGSLFHAFIDGCSVSPIQFCGVGK